MPLSSYGLLRGSVINVLPFQKIGDHYNIEVSAAGQNYRIAVDVYSTFKGSPKYDPQDSSAVWDTDRLVLFYQDDDYTHPVLNALAGTTQGYTAAAQLPAILHLDYIRTQPPLFPLDQMKVVPPKVTDDDGNDLNDDINPRIQKALNNPLAEIFAFGDFFNNATSTHPDHRIYFNPNPLLGIHDIHMNQGDSGSQEADNGIGQDGALFLRYSTTPPAPTDPAPAAGPAAPADTWVAMFFRFENQSINTDGQGNPI